MDSFYDTFDNHEAPGQPECKFANRDDLSKPYSSDGKKTPEYSEPVPTTGAMVEWWRFFTRQRTNNTVAQKVNNQFTRASINGDNYTSERERYIKLYNEELERL